MSRRIGSVARESSGEYGAAGEACGGMGLHGLTPFYAYLC